MKRNVCFGSGSGGIQRHRGHIHAAALLQPPAGPLKTWHCMIIIAQLIIVTWDAMLIMAIMWRCYHEMTLNTKCEVFLTGSMYFWESWRVFISERKLWFGKIFVWIARAFLSVAIFIGIALASIGFGYKWLVAVAGMGVVYYLNEAMVRNWLVYNE